MIYQNKSSRFNVWKLAIALPVTATLLMLFSFKSTSDLPVFSENSNSTLTKNELDRPYALRFGEIEFTLDKQKGDGRYWNPPTYVITYEAARRMAQYQPILINRNNDQTYNFQLDVWFGEMTINPETIIPQADIAKTLSELNQNKYTYISLKNIKLTSDTTLLNLRMEIVPEDY
ncbi:MAG: hypothetical protein HRU41_41725 [Saprospiraceae bacterium]|nr:hypothetical protein [Saprospiraceae bacterium]